MTKLPRKRRREIRGLVHAILAQQMKQLDLANFTEGATEEDVAYAEGFLQARILSCETLAAMSLRPEDDQ